MLIVLKHFSWLLYFLYQLSGQEGLHREKNLKNKNKRNKIKNIKPRGLQNSLDWNSLYCILGTESKWWLHWSMRKSRRICYNHNTIDTKKIIILSKRNAGGHMEQRLRECPRETCLTGKPSYGQAPIHDIIMDTLLCSHKWALIIIHWEDPLSNGLKQMQRSRVKYWMYW